MYRKLLKFTVATMAASALSIAIAAPNANNTPTHIFTNTSNLIIPSAPNIDAKSYVLMDANSGTIIAQKNMNARRPPASLTKLMTLYVTEESLAAGRISLNDEVLISKKAWRMGGSKMFIKVGTRVPVHDLIQGIIVDSGNDACVALAQYIGGNEKTFAKMMDQAAAKLGMKDTHYVDSTGLPHPDHYATAHDLAILARAVINEFPQYYGWYKQKWFTYSNIKQPNRNRLLWRDPSVDGLKTGHTKAAGYCLISSALRGNTRLISVVMGTPSDEARNNDSQALLNYGYRYFTTQKVLAANQIITKARVWMGESKYINLGSNQAIYVTVPRGNDQKLQTSTQIGKLTAPITKGQAYGNYIIALNGKTIKQVPMIAMQNDPEGGLFRKTSDRIASLFS